MNMATEKSKIPTNANPSLAGAGVWVIPLKCGQYSYIVLGRCMRLNAGKEAKNHRSGSRDKCQWILLWTAPAPWLESCLTGESCLTRQASCNLWHILSHKIYRSGAEPIFTHTRRSEQDCIDLFKRNLCPDKEIKIFFVVVDKVSIPILLVSLLCCPQALQPSSKGWSPGLTLSESLTLSQTGFLSFACCNSIPKALINSYKQLFLLKQLSFANPRAFHLKKLRI